MNKYCSLSSPFWQRLKSTPYAADALYWAMDKLDGSILDYIGRVKSAGEGRRFNKMTIQNINICSARCVFCAYPKTIGDATPKTSMSLPLFDLAVARWREYGGRFISFAPQVGELFVDREIDEKMSVLRRSGVTWAATTNATHLAAHARHLIACRPELVNISMGGFDRASYKLAYGVDRFDDVYCGLCELCYQNRLAGDPVLIVVRIRNAVPPRTILRSPWFKAFRKRYMGERVLIEFTRTYDNWGGMITEKDLAGTTIRLRQHGLTKDSVDPCLEMTNASIAIDGAIKVCGCRFDLRGDSSDHTVGHINEGFEPAFTRARAMMDAFKTGAHPKTCQSCTVYVPTKGL
jgi:hypothetical protein